MRKSREFDNVLNECLERLLVNGETIEQCLASCPKQATELKPLLQTALVAKNASVIQPRPEFKARARYQFHLALQEVAAKRSRPLFGWQPRWATAIAIVLILLLTGGSTVAAADNSMPDGPLYGVKLATEQVRLTLTPSELGKAQLYASFTDKRVLEIARMAKKGKSEQVERTTQRLNAHLAMITQLVSAYEEEAGVLMAPAPAKVPGSSRQAEGKSFPAKQANMRAKLRTDMAYYAIHHPAVLRAALKQAPEAVKPALLRAIAVSEANYEKALEALD